MNCDACKRLTYWIIPVYINKDIIAPVEDARTMNLCLSCFLKEAQHDLEITRIMEKYTQDTKELDRLK
jgi:hypothetical protein